MSDKKPGYSTSRSGAPRERIAKAIARAGLCSRREAEAWIAEGRVAVNGDIIASPALTVTAQDQIEVNGELLPKRERTRLFLYYKPVGLVTTTADPDGRPTIFSALPANLPRLISVGRLDIATEGLLLLTNDGGLARMLELPATGWLRRYRVRAHGRIDQAALDRLREGVTVDGVRYGPIEATLDREQGANVWLTMAIREGKNREVRNVVESLGLQANRLIRVSFGPFQLGEMQDGDVIEVKTRVLREQLGERLAREAGCDFAAPVIVREAEETQAPPRRPERGRKAESRELQQRPERGHGQAQSRRPQREPEREGGRGERERRPDRERARERLDRAGGKRPDHAGGKRPDHAGGKRPRRRSDRELPEKPLGRPRRGHAWRAEDAPVRRHYRGARAEERQRDATSAQQPRPDESGRPKRSGLIADRKGRRVLVERFGEKREVAQPHAGPARLGDALPPPAQKRGRPASQSSPGGGRKPPTTAPRTADRGPTLPFKGRAKPGLKSQGEREQTRREPPREVGGKPSRKVGDGPPRRDDGKPARKFGGKPARHGKPAPRDRPRGQGPRPSRPKPR
jgi:23S rRNA pseudouridine2605 synthase